MCLLSMPIGKYLSNYYQKTFFFKDNVNSNIQNNDNERKLILYQPMGTAHVFDNISAKLRECI